LDYFSDNDTRYLVEEISTDFKPITDAVITAILVTNKGIPSDGFWTLADIQNRSNGLNQYDFHKDELEKLSNSLKDYDCCD
jgi:D-mannonate dehydratase